MDKTCYKAEDLVQYRQIKALLPHLIGQISCMKCKILFNHKNFKMVNEDPESTSSRKQSAELIQGFQSDQLFPTAQAEERKHSDQTSLRQNHEFNLMQFDDKSDEAPQNK